jgi:dienelactone hydrolase
MLRTTCLLFFLVSSLLSSGTALAQAASSKDVDILAPDGTKLRATFFRAAKAGPGVLLMHMCVTTRKSWEPVAKELSAAGISVLTIDNRGFGESGGPRYAGASPEVQQQLAEKWPGDFDAAYKFLSNHAGVDAAHIGAGGGSCGVDNAIKLAERHPDIKTLVLLAGSTDLNGIDFLLHHQEITIFTAAAADDQYITDAPQLMRWFSELSGNPHNQFESFPNGRHGTEIFWAAPGASSPDRVVFRSESTDTLFGIKRKDIGSAKNPCGGVLDSSDRAGWCRAGCAVVSRHAQARSGSVHFPRRLDEPAWL